MRIILNKTVYYHVSHDTIKEFERIIISDSQIRTAFPVNTKISNIVYYQWRLFNKLGIIYNPISYLYRFETGRHSNKMYDYFIVLMGSEFNKCLPHFILPGRKSIYMFDAWPKCHDMLRQFVRQFKVDY